LHQVPDGAVPSLLRGFSAPVQLQTNFTEDDLLTLLAFDKIATVAGTLASN
jgi:aminopeptidase N